MRRNPYFTCNFCKRLFTERNKNKVHGRFCPKKYICPNYNYCFSYFRFKK